MASPASAFDDRHVTSTPMLHGTLDPLSSLDLIESGHKKIRHAWGLGGEAAAGERGNHGASLAKCYPGFQPQEAFDITNTNTKSKQANNLQGLKQAVRVNQETVHLSRVSAFPKSVPIRRVRLRLRDLDPTPTSPRHSKMS